MTETPREEQGVPAGETPQEVQRSWTSDVVAYALGAATSGVVNDAYGAVKGAVKDVVDKIRDGGPGGDPPAQGDGSAELRFARV